MVTLMLPAWLQFGQSNCALLITFGLSFFITFLEDLRLPIFLGLSRKTWKVGVAVRRAKLDQRREWGCRGLSSRP